MHRKPQPLVVQIPLWLKAAAAGSVGLVMVVFFEVGYSLGSRHRAELPPVAQIEPTKKPEPASAAMPIPQPKAATPEPAKPQPKKPEPVKRPEPPAEAKKPEPALPENAFVKIIQPIFRSKCLSCHGDPATKAGLDLRTLASIRKGGNSGPGMVPGNLKLSQIWLSIDDCSMPPTGKEKLTDDEIKVIQKWIAAAK